MLIILLVISFSFNDNYWINTNNLDYDYSPKNQYEKTVISDYVCCHFEALAEKSTVHYTYGFFTTPSVAGILR